MDESLCCVCGGFDMDRFDKMTSIKDREKCLSCLRKQDDDVLQVNDGQYFTMFDFGHLVFSQAVKVVRS